MLRNTFFALSAVLALAVSAQAAITITGHRLEDGVDTEGLAGYKTYTLTATSDDGPITAIDFVGDGSNEGAARKGFFGPLNQVNPNAFATIFADINGFFGPTPVAQDSQFKIVSNTVVVPPGLAEEGPGVLQAAWAWSEPAGLSIPFAQLAIPTASSAEVLFNGAITVLQGGVNVDIPVSGIVGAGGVDPNTPPVLTDAALNILLPEGVSTTLVSADDGLPTPGLTWALDSFAGPAGSTHNAPTLNASTGLFEWTPGSAKGGQYLANITATDNGGLSDTGVLTINVTVPEPSTIALLGLSVVGLVGLARRRS